jgi:class 3 adenylate cyclase
MALSVLILGILAGIAGTAALSAQGVNGSASSMPMMPGMNAGAAAGAPSARAFYFDRMWLLLFGTVATAAGVVAYRHLGSGRRAVSAVNEAVLVVDLVDSTHLATHYGDMLAMRARNTLKDLTRAAAEQHGVIFAENTGDGWFMTFPSVAGALETASDVLRGLCERPPDLAPAPPIEARAAITYGEILLDARCTRHGATINKAFRVIGLSEGDVARAEGAGERLAVPDRNRLLIDEEANQELHAVEAPRRFVGFCRLKGFSGLHGVYEVLWGPTTVTHGRRVEG